jgi:hypothetical protein
MFRNSFLFHSLSPFISKAQVFTLALVLNAAAGHAQHMAFTKHIELPDPKMSDSRSWSNAKQGAFAGFVSADNKYGRNDYPGITTPITRWNTKAWKGERVHTKMLIWTTTPLENATVEITALKASNGEIPVNHITTGFIHYVMTDGLNRQGGGCGIPAGLDTSLAEDLIDTPTYVSVKGNTVQPVWLSIAVPPQAKAGKYSGTVKVKNGRQEIALLSYSVEVLNRTLPAPKDWKFHLDLWQNPYSVARVHQVQPWSAEHMQVMRPYMKMLADAGQKAITATIIYDPWNSQTYDVYGSMVKWTKKKDGKWHYDYSAFDKWVAFMKSIGIGDLINCYSMIPWNLKFYYHDEAAGKDTMIVAQPGSPEYAKHWVPMLTDFARHLKQKGWFSHTTIAMDERPMDAMQKAIAVIKAADKDFKISLAGAYHPELKLDLFDYCVASNQVIDAATMAQRKKLGFNTTYYTCCVEGFPNTFTFSPPAESAWLSWHAANKGYDGYLRWAYNCWPSQPLQDSRFGRWSAGDTYFVYPGYRSSIRFERLKEGIQDYEKIRLLKEEFRSKNQSAKLAALEESLRAFELDALKTVKAGDMLAKAKELLNGF